ncbi:MAG: hypothetical protein FJY11_01480 [Bacteroidetes bacterium]|nr:hypothetical protein [Bacteroidota bacterium]
MNSKFRIIIEFAWIVVFIMAAVAVYISVTRGETRDSVVFSIIAVVSAAMYLFRWNQRKKS